MEKICKNCGAKLDENSKFCYVCGNKVEDENVNYSSINEHSNQNQNNNPVKEYENQVQNNNPIREYGNQNNNQTNGYGTQNQNNNQTNGYRTQNQGYNQTNRYQAQNQYNNGNYGENKQTNSKAIGSFVCSLCGLFFFQIILGIIATVLGSSAKKQIQQTGEGGSELATTGKIIGIIDIILGIISFVFIIVLIFGIIDGYNSVTPNIYVNGNKI